MNKTQIQFFRFLMRSNWRTTPTVFKELDVCFAPLGNSRFIKGRSLSCTYYQRCQSIIPAIEKKIIKPADIWMTLRLPAFVNANNPAFSLKQEQCIYAKLCRWIMRLNSNMVFGAGLGTNRVTGTRMAKKTLQFLVFFYQHHTVFIQFKDLCRECLKRMLFHSFLHKFYTRKK